MAYSVLSKEGKKGDIVHFLADTNEDYAFIIDTCRAGSTIKVLDDPEGGDTPNTYMKAPSGKWVHIGGEGEKELPANDAEVAIPSNDYIPKGSTIAVGEMQSNVKVYPSGLVTGNSYHVTGNKLFIGEEQNGHFVTVLIPTPDGATKMDIEGGTMTKKTDLIPDGFLTVRLDKMLKEKKDTMTVTFKKNTEDGTVASFKFNFSQMKLV